MVSLLLDEKVMFLIWFVGIGVIVAVVLIFLEIRLKKKREKELEMRMEKTPIAMMKEVLTSGKPLREKLDTVGKVAKDHFKLLYGFGLHYDYGRLKKEFEEQGYSKEANFCGEMFDAYYSDKELNDEKLGQLGDMLEEIFVEEKKPLNFGHRGPGLMDKVGGVLGEKKKTVSEKVTEKIQNKVAEKKEEVEREIRVAEREDYEILSWVRKAIGMGYDKEKILELMRQEGRSKNEIKKVLKVYEDEAPEVSSRETIVDIAKSNPLYGGSGVATRIVDAQKTSLREEEI